MSLSRDYENINSPKDPILAEIASSLAEKIEENASKSNLSTANVKSLLHVSISLMFTIVII